MVTFSTERSGQDWSGLHAAIAISNCEVPGPFGIMTIGKPTS